ncbi:MAG: Hemagglutinin-related protein [Parcubacteria group bacterium GW2011_GWC2_39_14]|nr:MAG: Hemagglutinin-related protein [Parcubacteria group bacterium GW2011_GWC2_39_14]KKR55390.1 MAG: Hemagglutinin-related protein [Parcubacteria group bacterium GW2011_GWA2_40_23]
MTKTKILFNLIVICALLVPFIPAEAASFDPGNIISDVNMTNYGTMTQQDIQNFLNKKSGTLKALISPDVNGIPKLASEIIYQAAIQNRINPMYLLVMLQKEMSLIEDSTPKASQYDWAMGYGVCDNCSVEDPKVLALKGFGVQVDRAAGVQRWFYDNAQNGWVKRAGKSYTIDNQEVFMQNQATANLYNYTPHIRGNNNFWKIWNNWFSQKYPDGTLLQKANDPGVWLIQNSMRRAFQSKSALLSRFDLKNIIIVSADELDKYEIGSAIKYPNYSLLTTPDGAVYMIVNDKLRKFESKEVIRTLGYNPEEFEDITFDELATYELGDLITITSSYPAGALLQDKKSGGVYFVMDGYKYPIIAREIMQINFPKMKITAISTEELDKFPRMDSVKIKDGTLVKSKEYSSVYVIANGQKMPISAGTVFEGLGYKWANIKVVPEVALSNLPQGNYLDLDYKK